MHIVSDLSLLVPSGGPLRRHSSHPFWRKDNPEQPQSKTASLIGREFQLRGPLLLPGISATGRADGEFVPRRCCCCLFSRPCLKEV